MSKKGQAAMEFLMTYGWAILVVLAAIGALAYFGVLSPSKHLPETCIFQQGIACLDFKVDSSTANIYIQNGFARDIDIYNISMGNCDVIDLGGQRIGDIDTILLNFTNCDNGVSGDKYKEDVIISYSIAGSALTKEAKGEILANIA